MKAQIVVFEQGNKQVIQEGSRFFTRVFENGGNFESADFNTLERAKESLGIAPTITESNKMIAKFMDWEIINNQNDLWVDCNPKNEQAPLQLLNEVSKDWNWLMEVLDKIENTEVIGQVFNVQIDRNKTHILYTPANYPSEKWFENLILKEGEDKLINTHQAVLEFIQWYNSQTN